MTITIRIDADRMEDLITVDEILKLQAGDLGALLGVMAKFVWTGEAYLDPVEGRAQVGKLTLRQMKEAAAAMTEGVQSGFARAARDTNSEVIRKLENVAVPPESAPESETA